MSGYGIKPEEFETLVKNKGKLRAAHYVLQTLFCEIGDREVIVAELANWDSFYVMVGSAAAVLIGLQFVILTPLPL